MEANTIQCPKCGNSIDVSAALSRQLESTLQQDFDERLARELKEDRAKTEQRLRKQAKREQAERVQALERELEETSQQVRELNQAKSTIERLRREQKNLRSEVELELRKELNKQLDADVKEHRQRTEGEFKLKLEEREQTIARLRKDLQEMSTHAEPPAPELKGGSLEQFVTNHLVENFPLDVVERTKTGQRGADVLQVVNEPPRQNCGTIYYECKNTRRFQNAWIARLRQNMLDKSANVGVLVSRARPRDTDRISNQGGIWICTPEEFEGLCYVLRDSLVQFSAVVMAQENRGDRMDLLYDFLTGDEFRLQIETVVEGFNTLRAELNREKTAMQGIWKRREQQIERVLSSTNHMYHSIKGIAGNAVQSVPLLELPTNDEAAE